MLHTLRRAKLAPSKIKAAGTDMPPRKEAVSVTKCSGGFPSGALGILVPVHPSTSTNNALRGLTRAQGMATTMAILAGMSRLSSVALSTLFQVRSWIEGGGVTGR